MIEIVVTLVSIVVTIISIIVIIISNLQEFKEISILLCPSIKKDRYFIWQCRMRSLLIRNY